ncbi:hypothetical protein FQN54_002907 [Arachnomyces sp. PD_36]|nr:hypothetical protein FQN54_002907 [Arachnomyces sp. PD_36]
MGLLSGRNVSLTSPVRRGFLRNGRGGYDSSPGVSRATFTAGVTQRAAFSTTIARRISEEEIEKLRTDISGKERQSFTTDWGARKVRPERKEPERRKPSVPLRVIQEEMRWLKDPAELAKRVATLLAKHQVEKAEALTIQAQKDGANCIVAWNHLIDFHMKKGRSDAAFKTYNDMKKRGRKPDAYTYTIMFRGFAWSHNPKSVSMALSVYDSLCKSTNVKPSAIHNNAVLNVCARHKNMDALWEILGKLPESGFGAPDVKTYTIILDAMRASTMSEIRGLDPKTQMDGILAITDPAVREAKRVWADVVHRWHEGILVLDTFPVSSMARMLLMSQRENHWRDVLALFHQAMALPNFSPNQDERRVFRGQNGRASEESTEVQKDDGVEDIEKEPESDNNQPVVPEESPSSEEEEFNGLFDPLVSKRQLEYAKSESGAGSSLAGFEYPIPGNHELTVLLEACQKMQRGVGAGRGYWEILTSETGEYRIDPDSVSYHEYLRVLRAARASTESVRVLREMVQKLGKLESKTSLIALSTCLRDRLNPNVLDNANAILELMASTRAESDGKILEKYVALIRLLTTGEMSRGNQETPLRFDDTGKSGSELKEAILSKALILLRPHIERLKDVLENGDTENYPRHDTKDHSSQVSKLGRRRPQAQESSTPPIVIDNAVSFLYSAQYLYTQILTPEIRNLLPKEDVGMLRSESKDLGTFLEAFKKRNIRDKFVYPAEETNDVEDGNHSKNKKKPTKKRLAEGLDVKNDAAEEN